MERHSALAKMTAVMAAFLSRKERAGVVTATPPGVTAPAELYSCISIHKSVQCENESPNVEESNGHALQL